MLEKSFGLLIQGLWNVYVNNMEVHLQVKNC